MKANTIVLQTSGGRPMLTPGEGIHYRIDGGRLWLEFDDTRAVNALMWRLWYLYGEDQEC